MPLIDSTYHRALPDPAGARRLLAALAAVLASLLIGPLAGARAAGATTLIVEGAGLGHGVGMSQYGALGYAEHGLSDAAILAHYYTGSAIGAAPAKALVRVLSGARVVKVPLERYVRGVVAAEMPSSWPLAALEAQAIASRTYALTAHAGGARFDVYSDTRSQVYLGRTAETAATNAAVAATAGQIVTYAGKPATTYFFSSSGGITESIENSFLGSQPAPWLVGVADPYDVGPAFTWRRSLSLPAAAARLSGLLKGTLRGIEVLKRGVSPRIISAELLGSRGSTPISGAELAARLGLNSTWAYFSLASGTRIIHEPDISGYPGSPSTSSPPPAPPPATSPPAPSPAPTVTGPQGGVAPPPAVVSTHAGGALAG